MVVLGLVQTSAMAMNSTIYAVFFHSDKGAALSSTSGLMGLGKAIAFAISTSICNTVYLIFLLSLACAATVLYLIAEVLHKKNVVAE